MCQCVTYFFGIALAPDPCFSLRGRRRLASTLYKHPLTLRCVCSTPTFLPPYPLIHSV